MAEFLPQLIWTAQPDGSVDYLNKRWEEYSGVANEENRNWDWMDILHPEDKQITLDAWEHAIETGQSYKIDHRLRRYDSEYRWFLSRGTPVHNEDGDIIKWFGTATDIDEQKQTEKTLADILDQLRLGEAKLLDAQKLSHTGSYTFSFSNLTFEWTNELFGIFGKDIYESEPSIEEVIKMIHTDDFIKLKNAVEDITHNKIIGIDFRIIPGDNSIRYLKATGKPIFDGSGNISKIFGTIMDITELKNVEQELKFSEQRYRAIVDTIPHFVFTAQPNGKIDYFSQNWKEFGSRLDDDVLGWNWKDVLHPDDLQPTLDAWNNSLSSGETYEIIHRMKNNNGEYHWRLSRAVPLKENGKIVKWFGTSTDIHVQKQIEEKLSITLNELKQTEERLRESNQNKDKLFSIISHDLRSPFNTLIGFSEFLLMEMDSLTPEEIKDFSEKIYRTTKRVFRLLENLLQWSGIQTGRMEYNPISFDIHDLLDEIFLIYQLTANKKKISLKQESSENYKVYADKNMISTVMRNLISNAIKFTHKNGKIVISQHKNSRFLVINVIDNGTGIPEEDIEKLFQLGERVSKSGTENEMGTGLGLLLCKEFVEKNGGKIWIKSEPGKGSTFSFSIPLVM